MLTWGRHNELHVLSIFEKMQEQRFFPELLFLDSPLFDECVERSRTLTACKCFALKVAASLLDSPDLVIIFSSSERLLM